MPNLADLASETKQRFSEEAERRKRNLVILFADMVGSTEYKVTRDLLSWLHKTALHNGTISDTIKEFGGQVVKYIGDEVMATFRADDQAHQAINAAIKIQEKFNCLNINEKRKGSEAIQCSIGISYGEVYPLYGGNDWYGTPVDVAARLVAMAKPRQILIENKLKAKADLTELEARILVYNQQMNPANLVSQPVSKKVKGITEDIEVCEVTWQKDFIGIIGEVTIEKQLAVEWKDVHELLDGLLNTFHSTQGQINGHLLQGNQRDKAEALSSWNRLGETGNYYASLVHYFFRTTKLQYNKTAKEQIAQLRNAYDAVKGALALGPTPLQLQGFLDEFRAALSDFMSTADKELKEYLSSSKK